jgi:hypothetical protein
MNKAYRFFQPLLVRRNTGGGIIVAFSLTVPRVATNFCLHYQMNSSFSFVTSLVHGRIKSREEAFIDHWSHIRNFYKRPSMYYVINF